MPNKKRTHIRPQIHSLVLSSLQKSSLVNREPQTQHSALQMSSFRSMREKARLKLLDKRERKRSANETTTGQSLQPPKRSFSKVPDSLPVSSEFYHSDNASGSFDLGSGSGSFQHLVLKPFSNSMEDSRSTALDKESALLRKRRIGRKSQSFSSLVNSLFITMFSLILVHRGMNSY